MTGRLQHFRSVLIVTVIVGFWSAGATAQPAPASAGPPDPKLVEDLVAAGRILADHGLLDGWGHVSVRHNRDPSRFLMSRGLSADLVTEKDILEFDLDSRPVDTHGLPMSALFTERYIHGEIYKMRPDVVAVVHTHAPSLIPFGVTKVPLRPLYHMSYFIAQGVPVYEIRDAGGMTDTFVRDARLGKALAQVLGDKPAVLQRGHGAVIVGDSIIAAVGRSVYLDINARLQTEAIALGGSVTYLDPEEARKRDAPNVYDRAWEMWKRKVTLK